MPVLPVCLLEPLWVQFSALLPERPLVSPTHPLGCHRPRIPDRVVFEHVIAALVHGSGYERIASPGCSDATIRRRLKEWAFLGVSEQVHTLALRAYDRMMGLELDDLAVDGCIIKAPSGGEVAGRSPVDRDDARLKHARPDPDSGQWWRWSIAETGDAPRRGGLTVGMQGHQDDGREQENRRDG